MFQNSIQVAAAAEMELRKRRSERLKNFATQRAFYQKNPFQYLVDRLGIKPESVDWMLIPEYANHKWDGTPNPFMVVLDALVNEKWCGVESATGPGKTFFGACVVLWFLDNFENSRVITTAPKADQLFSQIWAEISGLYPMFNKGSLLASGELRMSDDPMSKYKAEAFVAGVAATEESATKAQGFHAEHMLIILEETPGVPAPTIAALQNTSTSPHNIILAFGNPDNQQDNLHKFCMQDNVVHVRISAYDHPNVVLNNPSFIPGACSRVGLQRIISKFGEGTSLTLSRTRGISPAQAADALIRREWIERAIERFEKYLDENKKFDLGKIAGERGLGVDVANSEFGDKASFTHGKGIVCFKSEDFQCPDSNQLGHQVYLLIQQDKISIKHLGVDGVGVGAGTINTLKEYGITDSGVNLQGAAQPEDTGNMEQFNNLRSQMWWQAREDLRNDDLDMINDEDLIADLTAPKFTVKNGKIIVEGKEDIKKRLGRSPNKGDSFVYWNWRRKLRSNPIEFLM